MELFTHPKKSYYYGNTVKLKTGQKLFLLDDTDGAGENYGLLEDGSELMIKADDVDLVLPDTEFIINTGKRRVLINKETGEKVLFYKTKYNKYMARNKFGNWVKIEDFSLYNETDDKTFKIRKKNA